MKEPTAIFYFYFGENKSTSDKGDDICKDQKQIVGGAMWTFPPSSMFKEEVTAYNDLEAGVLLARVRKNSYFVARDKDTDNMEVDDIGEVFRGRVMTNHSIA